MTPKRFREALITFGFDQTTAAAWLKQSRRTTHNWANGQAPVHPAVAKLFCLMRAMNLKPTDVDKLIKDSNTNGKTGK